MILNIPYKLGQTVWVYKNERWYTEEYVPGDKSKGGDIDGPFDRGYMKTVWHDNYVVTSVPFHFGLLDNYSLDEIYKSKDECEAAQFELK